MPRAKAPPRVKGPYSERGGSRFRIRVCDVAGHRDLYFAMLQEAQAAIKQAARGLRQSSHCRQLGMVLDEYRAVRKGYVRESPFAAIQPVGRPSRGKKQLRFEEAERFLTTGFQLFDERQDTMALAAVTARLLGCRASEVVHLKVRDLDCGGTRHWIAALDSEYRGKTRNAARNPEVPDALRPRLLRRIVGLQPEDYLFGVSSWGSPRSRQDLYDAVRRVCLAARVPVVCPHSLRGLWEPRAGGRGRCRIRWRQPWGTARSRSRPSTTCSLGHLMSLNLS